MTTFQKQVFAVVGFLLLVIIATVVLAVYSQGKTTTSTVSTTTPITIGDHVSGNASSSISVIEYGDFECPACGAYEPIMEKLKATYGNKVAFVFRHFPLIEVHSNALPAAQASEAAGMQGAFWKMYTMIYTHQKDWSDLSLTQANETFAHYADVLGLDIEQFKRDSAATSTTETVLRNRSLGETLKIDHTPTFFLQLKQIPNPSSYEDFAKQLDTLIK